MSSTRTHDLNIGLSAMQISRSDPENMSMDNLDSMAIMKSSFETIRNSIPDSEKENSNSENTILVGGDAEEKKDELQ